MKNSYLTLFLVSASAVFADPSKEASPSTAFHQNRNCISSILSPTPPTHSWELSDNSNDKISMNRRTSNPNKPQGWSLNIGGTYTWMSFSTPPTYSGNTGGVLGKLSYQQSDAFFGQARSYYNLGRLSSSKNKTSFHEWYSEFVGGYCFSPTKNWTITPYAGLGLDFLSDHHTGFSTIAPIKLNYAIYYAVAGLETHYTWENWMLGLQVDCLPTFNQYLRIRSLPKAAWVLKNRTGVAVQLPFAYRYAKNFWLEFAPYYRFLPIGHSNVLGLPHRNLNQWGAFVTFRFFL